MYNIGISGEFVNPKIQENLNFSVYKSAGITYIMDVEPSSRTSYD
jgi:hypothetical protein